MTEPAEQGVWTLTSPSGRTWQADNPLKCASREQRERVPEHIAMERILAAVKDDLEADAKADRDRFHLWAISKGLNLRRDDHDGGYFYTGAREAWQAWREALRIERDTDNG